MTPFKPVHSNTTRPSPLAVTQNNATPIKGVATPPLPRRSLQAQEAIERRQILAEVVHFLHADEELVRAGEEISSFVLAEAHEQPLNTELVAQTLEGALRSDEHIEFFREMFSDPDDPDDALRDDNLKNGVRDELAREVARSVAELSVDDPRVTDHLAQVLEDKRIHIRRAAYDREDRRDGQTFVDAQGLAIMSTGVGHAMSHTCADPDFLYDPIHHSILFYPLISGRLNQSPDCKRDSMNLLLRSQQRRNTALIVQHGVFEDIGRGDEKRPFFDYMCNAGFAAISFPFKDGVPATVFVPGEALPAVRRLTERLGDQVELQRPKHGCQPQTPALDARFAARLRADGLAQLEDARRAAELEQKGSNR